MNYLVTLSFGKETIINAEQREKLKQILSSGLDILVEVNDILVQGRDIRLIEPTKTPDDYRLENQENMKRLMEGREEGRVTKFPEYQDIMQKWKEKVKKI